MANNMIEKDLGPVSAWAIAKKNGFNGTEAEWEALQANAAQCGSDAEAYAKGTRSGTAVETTDPAYHNNSKHFKDEAADLESDAEAYATGKRGGEDVSSDDPAYHNNAPYFKDQAEGSALDAEAYATGKRGGEDVDSDDPAYHNNAPYFADLAEGAKDDAVTAKEAAEDAQAAAELAKTYAQTFTGAPRTAAAAADMTDHDLIYVFTGTTTSSLTNGHWYFWDGTDWADGGAYNATALTTDTTLEVSGAAADSKTVGDKLSDLKSALNASLGLDYRFSSGDTSGNPYGSYALSGFNFQAGKKYKLVVSLDKAFSEFLDVKTSNSSSGSSVVDTIGRLAKGNTYGEYEFTASANAVCVYVNSSNVVNSVIINAYSYIDNENIEEIDSRLKNETDKTNELLGNNSIMSFNLLKPSNISNTTISGIMVTQEKDEAGRLLYVNLNGTVSSSDFILDIGRYDSDNVLPIGEYLVSLGIESKTNIIIQLFKTGSSTEQVAQISGSFLRDFTFTADGASVYWVRLLIRTGVTLSNVKIYPIIRTVNSAPAYIPYGIASALDQIAVLDASYINNRTDEKSILPMWSAGISIPDALVALFNGIKYDLDIQNRVAVGSGVLSHDSTIVVNDTKTKAFIAYVQNDVDTNDNPLTSVNAYVKLAVVDIATKSIDKQVVIVKNGDTIGGKSIISGAGVPNALYIDGKVRILYSAKLDDNKWYLIDTVYDGTQVESSSVCKLTINGNEYDFTTETISEHIQSIETNAMISANAEFDYKPTDGLYYGYICVLNYLNNGFIVKTADFENFTFESMPVISNNAAYFEGAVHFYRDYLYIAIRQNGSDMIVAKLNQDNYGIVETIRIPDASSRACWTQNSDDTKALLFHSTFGRFRSEAYQVYPYGIKNSGVVLQSAKAVIYPSIKKIQARMRIMSFTFNNKVYFTVFEVTPYSYGSVITRCQQVFGIA